MVLLPLLNNSVRQDSCKCVTNHLYTVRQSAVNCTVQWLYSVYACWISVLYLLVGFQFEYLARQKSCICVNIHLNMVSVEQLDIRWKYIINQWIYIMHWLQWFAECNCNSCFKTATLSRGDNKIDFPESRLLLKSLEGNSSESKRNILTFWQLVVAAV